MSAPIPNLRDVATSVNQAAGAALLTPGVLFRSGKLDGVTSLAELPQGVSVITLREEPEPDLGAPIHAHPIADTHAVYQLHNKLDWLWGVQARIAVSAGPILVHCAAGTDRTGVVVASVLSALGVDPRWILADYLRSPAPTHPARLKASLQTLAQHPSPHAAALEARWA